jgi:hypothetical protein
MCCLLPEQTTRYVDVPSAEAFADLGKLIVSRPAERTFVVEPQQGARCLRYTPLDTKTFRAIDAPADGEVSYFCDVSRDVATPGQVGKSFFCFAAVSTALLYAARCLT